MYVKRKSCQGNELHYFLFAIWKLFIIFSFFYFQFKKKKIPLKRNKLECKVMCYLKKERKIFCWRLSFTFFRLFFRWFNLTFRMLSFLSFRIDTERRRRWAASQLLHKLSRFSFKNIPHQILIDIYSYPSMICISFNNNFFIWQINLIN